MKVFARARGWMAIFILLVAGAPRFSARAPASTVRVAWTFRADFAQGLTGWMSFPLAQDIGFDPSLHTAQESGRTVLVREVEALGRQRLQFGVIRPLECIAGAPAAVELEYALTSPGQVAAFDLVLAAADGHRYTALLPRARGLQHVRITGNQLGLPAGGTSIQAVALIARVEGPRSAGNDRLTVSQFVVSAERRPEVEIVSPALERSEAGPAIVAREVVRAGSSLRLQLGASPARVELTDGAGNKAIETNVTGGAASVSLGSDPTPGLWIAKVTSGPAETDFRFLVLGPVPPHPRILLTKKRLAQLRTGPQYAGVRDQIHRQAQKLSGEITYNVAAGANIAHLPGGTGLHPGFVGELKAYFKVLEGYANAISYNALDYSINGDEAALASARRALLTVARWDTWTPPRFTSHGLHTYYEVGVFAQRVALGYDLIAPRLASEEKQEIARAFRRQIIDPTVKEYFLYNRMPLAASNWMANSLGGAIAAAVAVEGDSPDGDSRDAGALASLTAAYEQLLDGLFPGDGSEVEPAGYENFAMQGISWGMAALDALGVHPREAGKMWAGFWWPYYAVVHPGLVLDTGDFDGRLEKLTGFAWGAEHAGTPALREFYARSSTYLELSAPSDVQHTGRDLEQAAGPLDLVCCSTPPSASPIPPPSRLFRKRGSAVFRSGWGRDATVVSLRAGPWFNHEHHDQGSFQVAAFGDHLVGEAGYSGYYDDPNYPTYFTQAPGHNTVIVDGDPFSQTDFNGPFWAAFNDHPRFTRDLLAGDFDYAAADLAPAYAGQLREYSREFVFIKPDLLVVRDRIASAAPHVYTWLLHAPAGASLSMDGDRAAIQTPHARASVLASGVATAWRSRPTPISITKFDDLEHGVIQTPSALYLESPSRADADFLIGFSFGPGAAPADVLRARDSPAGAGISRSGNQPAGVAFRTRPGALTLQDVSTDGSVLAVRGAADVAGVLAIGARTITRRGAAVFRSTAPVDVGWQPSAATLELNVHATATVDLEIVGAAPPATVRVDGSARAFTVRDGMVVIRGLPGGEHRVSIGY